MQIPSFGVRWKFVKVAGEVVQPAGGWRWKHTGRAAPDLDLLLNCVSLVFGYALIHLRDGISVAH